MNGLPTVGPAKVEAGNKLHVRLPAPCLGRHLLVCHKVFPGYFWILETCACLPQPSPEPSAVEAARATSAGVRSPAKHKRLVMLTSEKDGGDTDTDTGAPDDERAGTPAPREPAAPKTAADMLMDAAAEVGRRFLCFHAWQRLEAVLSHTAQCVLLVQC